ncbi:MAG: hypothetical protein KDH96_13770, partial [Candidatus Riesia sp.]|nr:hypothetical protein [Candidatus Riesia sp.]
LQIKNSQVVGVIIFWEGSDNPYYRNGEYPEYLRVIEVNEAYGNIDDYEMDNIRLITVDQEGDFDENELIMEMRNNLNAGF